MAKTLQQLAASRAGAPGSASAGDKPYAENVGLVTQRLGGGAQQAPQRGVQGVTPGAVERRMGGPTPSQQGAQLAKPTPNPAEFGKAQRVTHKPDQAGPARSQVSGAVGNIENFIRSLQNRNRER